MKKSAPTKPSSSPKQRQSPESHAEGTDYDRGDSRAQPRSYRPYPEQPRDYDREEFRGADRGNPKGKYQPEGAYQAQPVAHGNEVGAQRQYRGADRDPQSSWRGDGNGRSAQGTGRARSSGNRNTPDKAPYSRKRAS